MPNDSSSPQALLIRWSTLLEELRQAGSREDVPGITQVLVEAVGLRRRLVALDPLETLERYGADIAAQVAGIQDPGRRTFWRLILASALLDEGNDASARALLQSIEAPYRLPSDADGAIVTILPPLLALDPDFALRLTRWKVDVYAAFEMMAAREPEPRVVEMARLLETSQDDYKWEYSMTRGALSAQRWDLAEAFVSVIERPMGPEERQDEPDQRRQAVWSKLGTARLRAGDPQGAIDAWHRSGGGVTAWNGLQEMREAGYTAEAEAYLASLEPEERVRAEEGSSGDYGSDPSVLDRAKRAARKQQREEALALLAEHDPQSAGNVSDRERLYHELDSVLVLALVAEPDEARTRATAALASLPETMRAGDLAESDPSLETTLAQLAMAAGEDLAQAGRRILYASGYFEDHDQSYDVLQDAVELATALGCLSELLARLPPPSDDVFWRERFVAYAAAQMAGAGQVNEAFEVARSLEDRVDRSTAFELVALTLQHQGLLKKAEEATLETLEPVRVLCELAGLHAGRGGNDEARRLFEVALTRARRIRQASEALAAAAKAGLASAIRPWLVRNLDELVGEPEKDLEKWTTLARRDARDWWDDGTPPQRGHGLDHVPGIEDPHAELRSKRARQRMPTDLREKADELAAKFGHLFARAAAEPSPEKRWHTARERAIAEAGEARAAAARGEHDGARAALARAMDAWQENVEKPWEQMEAFAHLAPAAATLEDAAIVLRERQPALVERCESPRDSTRGKWRRDLAWGLTDLGEWTEALAMAHGTAVLENRIEALKWFALSAPLDVVTRGQELLEDEPVIVTLLARLGTLDEGVRSLTDL